LRPVATGQLREKLRELAQQVKLLNLSFTLRCSCSSTGQGRISNIVLSFPAWLLPDLPLTLE